MQGGIGSAKSSPTRQDPGKATPVGQVRLPDLLGINFGLYSQTVKSHYSFCFRVGFGMWVPEEAKTNQKRNSAIGAVGFCRVIREEKRQQKKREIYITKLMGNIMPCG